MEKVKLYGVPRSGGTLVYNIIREVFPDLEIKPQTHTYFQDSVKAVVTYRDFRDSVISTWRVSLGFDEQDYKVIAKYRWLIDTIDGYKRQVSDNLNRFRNEWSENDVLFIKYENWFNNYDFLFERLEIFFDVKINSSERKILKKKYSRREVKKKIKQFKSFDEYDKKDHFHGYHIYSGHPATWKQLLRKEDHVKLTYSMLNELSEWGYIDSKHNSYQKPLLFDLERKLYSVYSVLFKQITYYKNKISKIIRKCLEHLM
ncbi:MAG: hypothetical protein QF443_03730 [Dehalococcoidia bacterium]|nr:hypothetical protein [Dehalococcoidia bacterium]